MSGVLQPPLRPHVRLWRIEHAKDGLGPFQQYNLTTEQARPCLSSFDSAGDYWASSSDHPLNMPSLRQDRLLRPGSPPSVWGDDVEAERPFKFAFPGLRELRRWFPLWALQEIDGLGYMVRVVSCPWPSVTRWRHQARYDERCAQLLHSFRPTDLLTLRA